MNYKINDIDKYKWLKFLWISNKVDKEIQEALDFLWLAIPITSLNEIKKAFRKKSAIYHPDKWGKVEDFIKLQKSKDLLIKYFYLLNKKNIDLKLEIEKLENSYNKLLWNKKIELEIKAKRIRLSFSYFLDIIFSYFFLFLSYIIWIILFICIYWILFTIPISFFEKNIETFEPNFKENIYITNGTNIWHYDNWYIRDLWEYDDEYKKHNIKIEPYEKLEEKEKIAIKLTLKVISSYLVILLLFSIFYYLFIKRFILKFTYYINKKIDIKIWNHRIKNELFDIDCEFRETWFYGKIINLIKTPKVYYFILLYVFVYLITYFIYLFF